MGLGNIDVLSGNGKSGVCAQSAKTRAKRVFARDAGGEGPLNSTHKPTKAATSWNAGSTDSKIFALWPRGMTSVDTSF